MIKEEKKLNYGIRAKLISAVAMLMVAVIMVVSSTYAWFTLSTAPEVTGISTAVGANGALEMVLLSTQNPDGSWHYETGMVGSVDDETINNYWGNIVDLGSYPNAYGTGAVTLYPSVLNAEGGKIKLDSGILATPKYNAGGRVTEVNANTVVGKYDGSQFFEDTESYGYRAIGVASGMTPRQLAFRSSMAEITALQIKSRNAATTSLTANGTALASIAVSKALKGDAASYDKDDVATIRAMLTGLEESLGFINDAYVQAAYAFAASGFVDSDEKYAAAVAAINNAVAADGAGIAEVIETLNAEGVDMSSALLGYNDKYLPALASLESAKTAITALEETVAANADTTFTYAQLNSALNPILNVDQIKINDHTVSEVKNDLSIITSNLAGGVKISMPTGSGIYSDIADLSGNYSANVKVKGEDVSTSFTGVEVDATKNTASDLDNAYLMQVKLAINTQPAPSTSSTKMPITEFYGYVIDLAFRTNAANANLLLQAEGIDRIYKDQTTNEETMGGGSTMTFKSDSASFTPDMIKNLMDSIRIVFFDTKEGDIYAYAKLDTANATNTADGITAKMYIYKTVENTYSYVDATTNETVYVYSENGTDFFTDEALSIIATIPEGTTPVKVNEIVDESNEIVALPQNEEVAVSALVYLDGEHIENKDVAATVAKSMYGTTNFQFATDAQLVPMEYAELHPEVQGND